MTKLYLDVIIAAIFLIVISPVPPRLQTRSPTAPCPTVTPTVMRS